jgi:hypothetical protein
LQHFERILLRCFQEEQTYNVVTAELPILFYNKVGKKYLGKTWVALKMNKKNCKIIGQKNITILVLIV